MALLPVPFRNTLAIVVLGRRMENPEPHDPGFPEPSLKLGRQTARGCRGGWGAWSAQKPVDNALSGAGCRTVPNGRRLKPVRCHTPLCVWIMGTVLRYMEHVAIVARREDRLMSAARPWQCYIRS